MKIYLRPVLLASILASCATTYTPPTKPAIQDTEIIEAPYNAIWRSVIVTLTEMETPIKIMDKESGLITTEFVVFTGGFVPGEPGKDIDLVAVRPRISRDFWTKGRYKYSVFITALDEESAEVKVIIRIEGFERTITNTWHVCHSKGVLEKRFFDSIRLKL